MRTIDRIATTFRAVLILAILLSATDLLAQDITDCATPDEEEAAMMGGGGGCSDQSMYIPDGSNNYQNTPNLVFRLNYHFIRPTNGSGPFAGDMTPIVTSEVAGMNWFYGNIDPPTLPVTPAAPYIDDSRVRFVLDGIYYHDDDLRYQHYLNATGYQAIPLRNEFGVNITTVINIFYYQNTANTSSYGIGYMNVVGMHNCFPNSAHGLLAHELGHSIGLSHTFSCGSTTCSDDGITDTYHPDCNTGWVSCGVNQNWLNPGPNGCTVQGTGVSNNIMGYNSCRKYLSPMQMGRIHYGSITNPTRRMYVKCTPDAFNPTMVISQSAVWESSKIINSNIELQPGVTLDVRCTLYMSPHVKVIVKQGARLIIDGGVLTSHSGGCHDFWQGIEAWGTTNQHQYPANQPTYQGLVVLKNGAVIEHARNGFTNWKPNDWNSRGGVLQVQGTLNNTGGTFRNCRRAAEFMQYRNFHQSNSSITRDNLSYFTHADFIVDNDYRGGDAFYAHVSMWDVTGIRFSQCDFISNQTSGPGAINQSHKLGKGILSLNASYTVNGQCAISLPLCEYGSGAPEPVCPQVHRRPSRFIGLDHGIEASNSGMAGRTFTVRDSYFENNICGVFSEGVDNAAMLRNIFVVGGRDVANLTDLDMNFQGKHRAVYTHHANAFRVEENDLYPATTPLVQVEGVVVGSTNAYNDQVYKNFSHGMDYGFVAENDCVDWNNPVNTGLSLLCNQNNQNQEEDFWLRSSQSPALNHCVKVFQGSTSKSAGNTFTPTQNGSSSFYNYHNAPQQLPITYFWEAPPRDLNTGAFNTPWVQRHTNISPANSCPTRITCGGSPQVKMAVGPQMEEEQLAYLTLKYVYESLLDGGDFEGLKETIMESWPQDAWELRNELMSKSPYLSVEILKEAGLKNILPHAMYLEVCVANPEATQRDGFVKWVQYEMPNPLPEYMVAQIVASWDQKTWRTSLESAMGWHVGEYQRLNDQVIGAMLNDTVPQPADSVLVRWQLNPSLRARYGEVGVLLEKNDFAAAEALLNGLDQTYRLQEADKQERDDMLALIAVVRTAQAADRSIMQLDSAEVQALEAIAARQPSRAATHARGILCFGYGICTPPVTGETPQPKSQWVRPAAADVAVISALIIHPNPANNWVAFSHTLTGALDRAYLRVRDMQGREVYSTTITSSPGQHIWDARGMAAGTYTVELHNKGTLMEARRVVVRP